MESQLQNCKPKVFICAIKCSIIMGTIKLHEYNCFFLFIMIYFFWKIDDFNIGKNKNGGVKMNLIKSKKIFIW